jgi:TPR repeat protein
MTDKSAADRIQELKQKAEQGDAQAQVELGECYATDQGVPKNYQEAVTWYRKAADQGDVRAQYNLGRCYNQGRGVTKDEQEAVKWLRKAAEQNHVEALYALGLCHATGRGVARDMVTGLSSPQSTLCATLNLQLRHRRIQGRHITDRKHLHILVNAFHQAAEDVAGTEFDEARETLCDQPLHGLNLAHRHNYAADAFTRL